MWGDEWNRFFFSSQESFLKTNQAFGGHKSRGVAFTLEVFGESLRAIISLNMIK